MFQSADQYQFLESVLLETLGFQPEVREFQFIYGGNFNLAAKVLTAEGSFFIKWNQGDHEGMFESEARSLNRLRQTDVLTIPAVHGYGQRSDGSYLMMDFLESSPQLSNYWMDFGQKLAQLHRVTTEKHGLEFNNYIGALPQQNEWMDSGIDFFVENRLKVQAGRALYEGKLSNKLYDQFLKFCEKLPNLIPNEKPALLHGDLWSGNVMTGADGAVALVDPATYFGLREAEIAFTTMFGGFDTSFYTSYYEAFPVEPGFNDRIPLYNLYPLLVHVNLFAGGYLTAVERILRKY
ncbi:ketosamine-3-kinase [Siphonobacter sp. SORGH_AS_0500]|uniref:fructosamine kinase family protein n=1 Tax=Siphonobacter sp. SORGH_AS_0500 TaxID=1864824 RepID=UPI000CB05980|nr:fructosamine kinase family protein [Siphonobacter sp. SORGH_AS_0500]PKK36556.1 ketosamine-3-kinase [Siphonobacter sp. SORGH_AS_0500]